MIKKILPTLLIALTPFYAFCEDQQWQGETFRCQLTARDLNEPIQFYIQELITFPASQYPVAVLRAEYQTLLFDQGMVQQKEIISLGDKKYSILSFTEKCEKDCEFYQENPSFRKVAFNVKTPNYGATVFITAITRWIRNSWENRAVSVYCSKLPAPLLTPIEFNLSHGIPLKASL